MTTQATLKRILTELNNRMDSVEDAIELRELEKRCTREEESFKRGLQHAVFVIEEFVTDLRNEIQ